jgi:hypothetical protein
VEWTYSKRALFLGSAWVDDNSALSVTTQSRQLFAHNY